MEVRVFSTAYSPASVHLDLQSWAGKRLNHEGSEGREGISAKVLDLTRVIVDSGLKVHQALGTGLLESAYEHCLFHELTFRQVAVRRQVVMPICYHGATLDAGYRLDLLVEEAVIVEIKAVEALSKVHQAQAHTYLKLSGFRVAMLMNFNVALFKDGVRRIVR